MTYPGNSSLSQDIQERIQSTYQQTLELASQGNRQEASLGCDFILRLDPEFSPAHTLLERLESGEGPVTVDDLRPGAPGFAADSAPTAAETPAPAEESELAAELRTLLDEGRHGEVVERAGAHRDQVMTDPALQELVTTAQSRQEADPYIQSFLGKAREALRHGETEQAKRFLENARELDPAHPAVRDFSAVLEAGRPQPGDAGEPSPAMAPDPSEPADPGLPDLGLDSLDLSGDSAAEPAAPSMPKPPAAASTDDDALTGGFSLDEPSDAGEPDGRIRELLAEGQEAFDRGALQEAIDAWSRIFLIDIDHPEAARRIEKARSLKDEQERQVEETFHDAVARLEAGETREAKKLFERVLELQPSHLAARDYLQDIEEGRAPAAASTSPRGGDKLSLPDVPTDDEPLSQEILVPPEPGASSETPSAGPRVSASAGASSAAMPSRKFLWIGGVVLLLVLAAAWFFFQRRDSLFPNAGPGPSPTAGVAQDPIEQATRLHDAGRTEQALNRLRRIPQGTEQYDEAQALISQWEAEAASPEDSEVSDAAAAGDDDLASATRSDPDRRGELIAEARRFYENDENLLALQRLEQAAGLSGLTTEETRLRQEIEEELSPLRSEIELVRGGDWEYVLRDLWRLHQDDPDQRDVVRLLVTAYTNLGVRDLQRGETGSASEHFQEALGFAPDDPDLQRHLQLAQTYEQRPKDLLYEIYARKLSFRAP